MSDELECETNEFHYAESYVRVAGTHNSSLITHHFRIWPDSGLTRNTRALGYRCSVPGLAGFTGAALCGARSLITCQCRTDILVCLDRKAKTIAGTDRNVCP